MSDAYSVEQKLLHVEVFLVTKPAVSAWLSLLELIYCLNYSFKRSPQLECSLLTSFVGRREGIICASAVILITLNYATHKRDNNTTNDLHQ